MMKPEQKIHLGFEQCDGAVAVRNPHRVFSTVMAYSVEVEHFSRDFTNLKECQLDTPESSGMTCVKIGGIDKKIMKSLAFAVTVKVQPGPASRLDIIRYYNKSLINSAAISWHVTSCFSTKLQGLLKCLWYGGRTNSMKRLKQCHQENKIKQRNGKYQIKILNDCNHYSKGSNRKSK